MGLHEHLIAKCRPKADKDNIIFYKDYRITLLKDRLFRLEKSNSLTFVDDPSISIWYRDLPKVSHRKEILDDHLMITTDNISIHIYEKVEDCYVIIDNNKVYLDNKGNLKGTYSGLDGCEGDINVEYKKGRPQIVLEDGVCSTDGVAIIDDSNKDILVDGIIKKRDNNEIDLYVFCYGNKYQEAVKSFYEIAGKAPLIPRFAFGVWWSRYHAYSDDEYINLMNRFVDENVPFTVATLDMDWHVYHNIEKIFKIKELGRDSIEYGFDPDEPSWKWGWTGYSWNRKLIRNPKKFNETLHKLGLKTIYNLHPNTICWYETQYEKMALALKMNPKEYKKIDLDFSNPIFINNYFDIMHHPLQDDGVDYWWLDDDRFMIAHYHYLDLAIKDNPIVLTRYTGVGSHRYPLGFSGDSVICWELLEYLPYFTATASNIVYTWWSHDIGGFMAGIKDDELYLRYIQLGVFLPILRLHCQDYEMYTKEPWTYDNGIGALAKEYLRYRHKLIPYLYSGAYRTFNEGLALIEPLYYYYPQDSRSYKYKNEYMFNGSLLVIPVTTKSKDEKYVKIRSYLPKGRWIDIFTGDVYDGNKTKYLVRSLSSIPVLAKDGSFVIYDNDKDKNNKIDNPKNLLVDVYSGNGSFSLYEDDDHNVSKTIFTQQLDGNILHISISFENDEHMVSNRNVKLRLINIFDGKIKSNKKVKINHDDNLEIIIDKIDTSSPYNIDIEYKKEEKLDVLKRMAKYVIQRLEGNNRDRERLYEELLSAKSIDEYVDIVEKSNVKPIIKQRLIEDI